MRHRVKGKKLGRNTLQRKALMKNLVKDLVENGEIKTTESKAKAIKGLVDKLIHKAQEGTVSARRLLQAFFGTRQVVTHLVDNVAPAMKDRSSGFTRITKLGNRRGDDGMVVRMELVQKPAVKVEAKKEEKKVEKKPVEVKKEALEKAPEKKVVKKATSSKKVSVKAEKKKVK